MSKAAAEALRYSFLVQLGTIGGLLRAGVVKGEHMQPPLMDILGVAMDYRDWFDGEWQQVVDHANKLISEFCGGEP